MSNRIPALSHCSATPPSPASGGTGTRGSTNIGDVASKALSQVGESISNAVGNLSWKIATHGKDVGLVFTGSRLWKGNKKIVLEVLKKTQDASYLEYVTADLKADRDFMLAAVRYCGIALKYAAESLRGDLAVVRAAMGQDPWAFQYASTNVVFDEVRINGLTLEYASKDMQNDGEVVLAAMRNTSQALEYAGKKVILDLVRKDGLVFRFTSGAMRSDKEVVLAAVSSYGGSIQYASEAMRSDKEVVRRAIHEDPYALRYASDAMKADRDVVLAAVESNGLAFQYASDAVKADRDIVLAAVGIDYRSIQFAHKTLLDDAGFLLDAYKLVAESDRPGYLQALTSAQRESLMLLLGAGICAQERIPGPWPKKAIHSPTFATICHMLGLTDTLKPKCGEAAVPVAGSGVAPSI